jgi:predicted permease
MRLYDLLLRCYPPAFRARFAQGMRAAFTADFETARRRGRWAAWRFVTSAAMAAAYFGAIERLPRRSTMRSLIHVEVRDALRSLRATPVVALVAIASLALGVGANTALFSIVNGLFLKPLPVSAPEQLVFVGDGSWTNPAWEALAERRPAAFTSLAAWSYDRFDLAASGSADLVDGSYVSGAFFDMLGVRPQAGRLIVPADDRRGVPGGLVAVISDRLWRTKYGSRTAAIGESITVNRARATIVGVTPPGFFGADVGRVVDVYMPIAGEGVVAGPFSALDRRQNFWLAVGGRRAAGVTQAQASAALDGVAPAVREAAMPPERTGDDRATFMRTAFEVSSLERGRSIFRDDLARPLAILMTVVGAVLLIACANIANVLLARASARRHEMSVRLALGASRWRLARQLLIESAMIAAVGAVAGLLIARFASGMLVTQFTLRTMHVTLDLAPDWRVFGFTAAVAALTTLLFGLAPAAGVSSVAPQHALKEQSRSVTGDGRNGVRHALLVAQVALSVAVIVGAGLFVRTFVSLARTPLGFDPAQLLVVNVSTGRSGMPVDRRAAEYERFREIAAAVPGVRAAAASFMTPLSGRSILTGVERPGMSDAPPDDKFMRVMVNQVSPEFFDVYGMRPLGGRVLTRDDRAGSPLVAVVNETFAIRLFGVPNAVGREAVGSLGIEGATRYEIVGVVPDTLYVGPRAGVSPIAYIAQAQSGPPGSTQQITVLVDGDLDAVQSELSAALGGAAPAVSFAVRPFDAQVRSALGQERLLAMLAGVFGAVALVLAGVGLYGVAAYSVGRRRAEIAIRVALGSSAARVVRLVVLRIATLVAVGALAGVAISLWLGRYVESLLFGVPARDPATLAAAVVVIGVIGLAAAWIPAARAAQADPLRTLRE